MKESDEPAVFMLSEARKKGGSTGSNGRQVLAYRHHL
jgi:hypothetical protein